MEAFERSLFSTFLATLCLAQLLDRVVYGFHGFVPVSAKIVAGIP
jgi:hypothetical protein